MKPDDIEVLIRNSGLHYTKEVDPKGGTSFGFAFDTSCGPLMVQVFCLEGTLSISAFLRNLDTVAAPKKDLYRDLLKLNASHFALAHVGIWAYSPDEDEWVCVSCDLPAAEASPELVKLAIQDTAYLAEQALLVIQAASPSPSPQKQPT